MLIAYAWALAGCRNTVVLRMLLRINMQGALLRVIKYTALLSFITVIIICQNNQATAVTVHDLMVDQYLSLFFFFYSLYMYSHSANLRMYPDSPVILVP